MRNKTGMKFILPSLLVVLLASVLVQCNDEKEKYYERPDWLEQPIYQVLEDKGNFTNYLQCVQRTEYEKVLKGAGYYSVFAPNDAAFKQYLQQKGYQSVADIPEEDVKQLVAYSIVYNKWTAEHLGDKMLGTLYEPGAYKRKTALYALPYQDSEYNNAWVFDGTQNGLSYYTSTNNYQIRLAEQNYKYLPVFTNNYFNSFDTPLTAADYKLFYPNSEYTGFNVQAGSIVTSNMAAENGIVHEVSSVNEPLPNLEKLLQNPEYTVFKSLLDKYKQYTALSIYSNEILEYFKKILPGKNIDEVYMKTYTGGNLAFSPNCENIIDPATGSVNSESSGNTMFIPKNDVLTTYIQQKLLKYYSSTAQLPDEIITTLLNAQMTEGLVWSGYYKGSQNYTGEYLNGQGTYGNEFTSDGIIDKKIASNGFLFSIDHVIKSRFFETVYSEIFVNPAHTLLNQAYKSFFINGLREDIMKCVLNGNISERYTLLNYPDEFLAADGFRFDAINQNFVNDNMPSTTGTPVNARLQRLIRMHIFPGIANNEVNSEITSFDNLPAISNYSGWRFINTLSGDVVRHKNNQLQAAGNIEDDTYATLSPLEGEYNNGQIFNVDRLLDYAPRQTGIDDARFNDLTIWQYLSRARQQNPNMKMFIDYLERSLKNGDSDDLAGIKPDNYYTILIPNNTAMNQAVAAGVIVALDKITAYVKDSLGNTTSTEDLAGTAENLAQITNFVNSHILLGAALPDDGLHFIYPVNPVSVNKTLLPTLLKITNEKLEITNAATLVEITKSWSGTTASLINFAPRNIVNPSGKTVVTGGSSGTMRIQRGIVVGSSIPNNFRSNRIACRAVIHEVNQYFTFKLSNP
ncbi:MAG: fasciclin domain-containing protein [Paludibacter sp.]|nr:fasciclin domain-containing protein [Paludibacter sp.]